MPDYQNRSSLTIHLMGPDGKAVSLPPRSILNLPEYYDRYVKAGELTKISPNVVRTKSGVSMQSGLHAREQEARRQRLLVEARRITLTKPVTAQPTAKHRSVNGVTGPVQQVVGRPLQSDATEAALQAIARSPFPISNGIGVGILSYNRPGSLRRLIDSITKHTDLLATTVFISDDASTDTATISYLSELEQRDDIVVLRNQDRLGVAGNTNRLLRCLSRFNHMLLLNDDVEILCRGWDTFYRDAAIQTGMGHFIHHQIGVYGGTAGEAVKEGTRQLSRIDEKPQGAILSVTHDAFAKMGFMNQQYGLYGMEHIDWSMKAWELAGQKEGFYDVADSSRFFKVYPEASAVKNRSDLLETGRSVFRTRQITRLEPSDSTAIPHVTYVVPFRNTERTGAIRTVINNIRAQRWPSVRIIMVEQDQTSKVVTSEFNPCEHVLVSYESTLFNKSLAFNTGVAMASGIVILHDADTMAQADYTKSVVETLKTHDACHIGSRVVYADQDSSGAIEVAGSVIADLKCDRVVGYYEGGSLACTTDAYWRVGGFNEDFRGYGCEDCDFYYRISKLSNWYGVRSQDLLHLWHGRANGWQQHHDANKRLQSALKSMPIEIYVAQQCARVAHYQN